MKTTGLLLVLSLTTLVAFGPTLPAADAEASPAGHWEGAIALPTTPLDIKVDLSRGPDQAWHGTIDIPAQGAQGVALDAVKVDGDAIAFALPGVPGDPRFAGRLADGNKSISGDFTQGEQTLPFKLARVAPPAAATPPAAALREADGARKKLEDRWQASLNPVPNVELRLVLEIAQASSAGTGAVLISVDQGNARIPVSTLSVREAAVHFESASIGGSFDGKLSDDASEIAGTWNQGGMSTPLVFKRLTRVAQPAATTPTTATPSAKNPDPRNDSILPKRLAWLVLSPIPVLPAGSAVQPDETAQKKAFAEDLLTTQGGEAQARPQLGNKFSVHGVEREWKSAEPVDGAVTLSSADGKDDFEIAYAATEFDVPADTQAWLGVGSDDGVRVWLNGTLVLDKWAARPVQVDEDVVSVPLKAGKNRLLLKVQNIGSSWGFACRLMDAEARAARLVAAARRGDLTALKDLIERGFELNGRTAEGLTPFVAARIWGQKDAADLLAKRGADTQAKLPAPEALIDALLAGRFSQDGAAAAVLVARNGKVLFEKAYGLADIEQHLPATLDTKFRIGSVTKQFTAAGILRLQESGRLKITDPLAKYYPDFPRGAEVTLQHLLTHTSGLHSYTDSPGFIQGVTKPTSTAEVVASIKKFPSDFNPGARWSYCNSGYFLLGDLVEKISGQPYGDYLRETLFAPLGMIATGVYRNDQPPAGAAVGYEFRDRQFHKALDWDMSWAGGAGAIYSTVKDLHRWNEAVFGGKVLSKDNLAAAFTPVTTEENKNDKSAGGYGYGWMISQFRGAREISHGGGLQGFLSHLLRFPEQNFTVVVLENQAPGKPRTDPGTLSREIAEIYLGAEFAPRSKAAERIAKPVPSAALAAIAGRYDNRNAVMVITQEGDRAYGQLGLQPKLEIFPESETEFFLKVVDAQITFVKDASGKVIEAVHHQNGQTLHAPRLDDVVEVKLADAQTDPLLGDYDYQPNGKATISRDGGRLYGQLTGQPKLELGATSDTEFFVRQVNAQLTFVKGPDGKVTKLILHQAGQNLEMPRLAQP